jgi:hypothetical protein
MGTVAQVTFSCRFFNSFLEDPPATDPESIELFTADGERVMFKYDGTYEIVSSGLIVHRLP